MAADQRKKPVSTVRIASSQEHGRAKKKKLGLIQHDLNVRSNISLEWDDKKNNVVAKREQIGLTQRHLIAFDNYVSHCHSIVADVLTVPREIFELDILKEVLSSEVWQTLLSENERRYLMQFLPKGSDMLKVVQELLDGHNFHFGNPFLKWSASLYSGDLHPDVVLHREQCIRASKKTYYSDLLKYHNGMINNLLMWKERWASSKNPEKEIVQKIWRGRKQAGNFSSDVNEVKLYNAQEDVAATSDSGSWAADDNAVSSDDQNLVSGHGERQQRKDVLGDKYNNLAAGLKVVARPKKAERLHKQNIQCGDGSKYMSYIKVSREQHQRVKNSMKHSSNSIQSRSLNRVLGNLHTLQVQPFEVFEEEEQNKLHAHWLQLAIKDIPAAFANFRRWQLGKSQLLRYWKQEMEEKFDSVKEADLDEEKDDTYSMLPAFVYNRASSNEAPDTVEIEEREHSEDLLQEHLDDGADNDKGLIASDVCVEEREHSDGLFREHLDGGVDNNELFFASEVVKKEKTESIVEEVTGDEAVRPEPTKENDYQFARVSTQNQHLQKIPELGSSHKFCSMEVDSDNYVIRERDDSHPNVSEYSENLNRVEHAVSQGVLSASSNVWPPVSIGNSYHHSTPTNYNYGSAQLLSLSHSRNSEEQQSRLIDLESDNHEEDAGINLLHKQSHSASFLSPFTNRDARGQNELLQHYFKGPDSLPSQHGQKLTRFDFQQLPASSNVSVGRSQFSGSLSEHLSTPMPLELRQNRSNIDTDQNIREKMFSDGFRCNIPMQEHLLSVNFQDWAVNTTQMLSPLQSHLGGGEMGGNRFLGDHQIHGDWSNLGAAVGPSSHLTGSRSNNKDQSFFGTLSQYNELPYGAPYDSVGSTERFIQSGLGTSYGGGGGVVPSASNVLLQTTHTHPLGYLSGQEEAAAAAPAPPIPVKSNNLGPGWMSIPAHHNSALQESMAKPFVRSWNS